MKKLAFIGDGCFKEHGQHLDNFTGVQMKWYIPLNQIRSKG